MIETPCAGGVWPGDPSISLRVRLAVLGLAAAGGAAWVARNRVLVERLDLGTFLWIVVAVAAATLAAVQLLVGSARHRTGLTVSVVVTAMMLTGVELGLRSWRGTYSTYLERTEGRAYQLQYHHTSPRRHLVYAPNVTYTHPRSEFAFPRTTNSLGLADRELPVEKAEAEYRIVALGDSYTEGVGAASEDTWLAVAARRFAVNLPRRTVTTLNAGISGSDPWYGFVLLADTLIAYRPDLVLVAINASDVNDVIIRGGRERFLPDGTVRPRPTPSWEWLYGVSYLARHVIHDVAGYNSLFVKISEWPEERRRATALLTEAVRSFARVTTEHGIRLVVVCHPDKQEASRQRYERAFASFVGELKREPGLEVVDVLERWQHKGLLPGEGAALFWPIDGHNTPKGYAAFGDVVAEAIRP